MRPRQGQKQGTQRFTCVMHAHHNAVKHHVWCWDAFCRNDLRARVGSFGEKKSKNKAHTPTHRISPVHTRTIMFSGQARHAGQGVWQDCISNYVCGAHLALERELGRNGVREAGSEGGADAVPGRPMARGVALTTVSRGTWAM